MKSVGTSITYLLIGIFQFLLFCNAQTCSKLNLTSNKPIYNGFQYMFINMDYLNDVMDDPNDVTIYPEDQIENPDKYTMNVNFLLHALSADVIMDEMGDGIIDPNFQVDIPDNSDNMTTLFDQSIDGTNFGVIFNRFFVPNITGSYKFSVSADGAGLVSIMNSFDYYCCQNVSNDGYDPGDADANFQAKFSNVIADTGNSSDIKEVTLYLEAGSVSLLQMVAINRGGEGRFNFAIIDPNGKSLVGLPGYIADVDITPTCNKIVTSIETANVSSTTTYSSDFLTTTANELEIPEYQTTYYVFVPYIASTSSSSTSSASSSLVSSEITSSTTSTYNISTAVSSNSISYNETASLLSSTLTDIPNSSKFSSTSTSGVSSESSPNSAISSYASSSSILSVSETTISLSNLTSDSLIDTPSDIITATYSSLVPLTTVDIENKYTNSSGGTNPTDISYSTAGISKTEDNDNTKTQFETTTTPCTRTECTAGTPKSSTLYITKTIKCETVITTQCSITHSNSIEVVTSIYTKEIETLVTKSCSGKCYTESTDNLALETFSIQEVQSAQNLLPLASSSAYLVDNNKNNGIHNSFDIFAVFISLVSIFATF